MRKSSLPAAALVQLAGAGIAFALVFVAYPPLWQMPLALAVLQGLCAALVAWKLDAPRWWWGIHLVFMPLVVVALVLAINPLWYLAAFVTTLLLFWRTDQSRVPLYLSNQPTAEALLGLLPATPCRVLDAGCGDGSLLRRLARARPDCRFTGIEHAPATWLWARLLSRKLPNLEIIHGDFWRHDFSPYQVVYAFLSPAPMAELWDKARAEMPADSCLISNSFTIPGQSAAAVVTVADRRQTRLHCFKPRK